MYKDKVMVQLYEIVEKNDVCLPVDATFLQLIQVMHSNAKGVVVLLKGDKPVGILTERDVVQMMYNKIKLEENIYFYARKTLVYTNEKRCIGYALNLMLENNIRHLVVINDDGTFTGIITQKDLLEKLEEEFDHTSLKIKHVKGYFPDLIAVDKKMNLREVLHKLMHHQISSVPVLEDGKAIGMITERDILKFAKDKVRFEDNVLSYMSSPVYCVDKEMSVVKVVQEMTKRNIRRVVVNDEEGKAESLLTDRDFARNLKGDFNHFMKLKLTYSKEILNLLPEMLIELVDLDEEQLVIWGNEKALNNFGTGFLDKPITELVPSDRWQEIYTYLCDNSKVSEIRFERDERIYEISGFYLYIERSDEKGRIQLFIRDITEEVILATVDPLTNIFNRRHINNILIMETDRCRRFSKIFSIAMIDIDDFKLVNDQHGHLIGDLVLQGFTKGIKDKLRQYDVIGRYGGEEFLLVLPELPKEMAFGVIDRIRSYIEQLQIKLENQLSLNVTASFGVACFPEDAESPKDLLIKADEKLYQAKRSGKNRVIV